MTVYVFDDLYLTPPLSKQDVLFLIFAGSYVSGLGTLTIPSFFSLSLSIVGVCSYLVYLVLERNSIHTYFLWIKTEAHKRIKVTTQGAEPQTGSGQGTGGQGPAMNGRRPGGPYGSSESDQSEDDSQGTTQPDAGWMYNSTHLPPSAAVEHIPLPIIHEGSESMDQTGVDHLPSPPPPPGPPARPNGVLPMAAGGRLVLQGHMDLEHGDDSDTELSQVSGQGRRIYNVCSCMVATCRLVSKLDVIRPGVESRLVN